MKKKSSKIHDRITSLQSKLVKGEDGKIYVSIKPKLERRIVDIQEEAKEMMQNEEKTVGVNEKETSVESINTANVEIKKWKKEERMIFIRCDAVMKWAMADN